MGGRRTVTDEFDLSLGLIRRSIEDDRIGQSTSQKAQSLGQRNPRLVVFEHGSTEQRRVGHADGTSTRYQIDQLLCNLPCYPFLKEANRKISSLWWEVSQEKLLDVQGILHNYDCQ